jgi:hypothetical protein
MRIDTLLLGFLSLRVRWVGSSVSVGKAKRKNEREMRWENGIIRFLSWELC